MTTLIEIESSPPIDAMDIDEPPKEQVLTDEEIINRRVKRFEDALNHSRTDFFRERVRDGIYTVLVAPNTVEAMSELRLSILPYPERIGSPVMPTRYQLYLLAKYLFSNANDVPSIKTPLGKHDCFLDDLALLLNPGTWINEVVVDCVAGLLEIQSSRAPPGRRVALFRTNVWRYDNPDQFISNCYDTPEKEAYLKTCKYIFCPIPVNGHWTLLKVDTELGRLSHFDSFKIKWRDFMANQSRINSNIIALRKWLRRLFPDHRWMETVQDEDQVQQFDGCSCALYVMHTMEVQTLGLMTGDQDLNRKLISEMRQITWDDDSQFLRIHYAIAILSGKLNRLRQGDKDDDFGS